MSQELLVYLPHKQIKAVSILSATTIFDELYFLIYQSTGKKLWKIQYCNYNNLGDFSYGSSGRITESLGDFTYAGLAFHRTSAPRAYIGWPKSTEFNKNDYLHNYHVHSYVCVEVLCMIMQRTKSGSSISVSQD